MKIRMNIVDKQTIIKMVLEIIRGKKTTMDPYFIEIAKNYGIFFETEPTEYSHKKIKKIIINIK